MIISHKSTTSFRNNTSPQATHNRPFTVTLKIHSIKSARSLKQQCPHLDTGKQTQLIHAEKFDKSQLSLKCMQHYQQITTNFTGQEVTSYLHATKKGEEKSDPYIIDI